MVLTAPLALGAPGVTFNLSAYSQINHLISKHVDDLNKYASLLN